MEVKYPDIAVQLTGHDGNAMIVMGRVASALRKAGVAKDEIDEFYRESMRGDYDHLLQTAMAWVAVS